MDPITRDHFIFECTAGAAVPFEDWILTYQTLRGCYFQATRPQRRRNGKVEITCKPADQTKITLPRPPNIQRAMAVIWQLPGASVQSTGESNLPHALTTNSDETAKMRINAADFETVVSKPKSNGSTL